MARFEIPDGWTVQAFQFALDCTRSRQHVCGAGSAAAGMPATGPCGP